MAEWLSTSYLPDDPAWFSVPVLPHRQLTTTRNPNTRGMMASSERQTPALTCAHTHTQTYTI